MVFKSQWITTEEFKGLKTLDMYHKELEEKKIPKSPYCNYHVRFRKKLFLDSCENIYIKIFHLRTFLFQRWRNTFP